MTVPLALLDSFSGAVDFIFSQRESFGGGTQVGGLGSEIVTGANITFRTGVVTTSALLIGMAIAFDVLLLLVQRRLTRWRSADATRSAGRTHFLHALARSRTRDI